MKLPQPIPLVIVAYLMLSLLGATNAGRILVLSPFNGPSHWIVMKYFINEMVHRGHHVTAVTGIKYGEPLANYTEILIDPPFTLTKLFSEEQVFDIKYSNPFMSNQLLWNLGIITSEHGLKSPNVQALIQSEKESFDLILSEQFYQESWLMFAHKYKAPIVTIGTMGYSDFHDHFMGLIPSWAIVPHHMLNYDDKMTYPQRVYNVVVSLYDAIWRKFIYLPEQNRIAHETFSSLKKHGPLPNVADLENSISVLLMNTNYAISSPRALMPGMINIAGATIKPAKPLPQEIQTFLDGAEHGAIYLSLGAFVKSSKMPREKVQILLDVFSKLKQRVLWKWEDDNAPNLPSNILTKKWMPQTDILAHKNVVLFITHGGMSGTIESIHRGVPMLYIPFYGDQHRNAIKSTEAGIALHLPFNQLDRETLIERLNELLNNKKYHERAKEVSEIFRDNENPPMDTAMYWIEYVIRHKGAKHLKSAGSFLPWYKHLLLDVYALFLAVFMIILFVLRKLFRLITKKLKNSNKQKTN